MRHVFRKKNVRFFFVKLLLVQLQKFIKNVIHANIQMIISKSLVVPKNARGQFEKS